MKRALSIIAGMIVIFSLAFTLTETGITGMASTHFILRDRALSNVQDLSQIKSDYFDNRGFIEEIKDASKKINFKVPPATSGFIGDEEKARSLIPYLSIALLYQETNGFKKLIRCDPSISQLWNDVNKKCENPGTACTSNELYNYYSICKTKNIPCNEQFTYDGESFPAFACTFGIVPFQEALDYGFVSNPKELDIAYYSMLKYSDIYSSSLPTKRYMISYLTDTILAYRLSPEIVKLAKDRCNENYLDGYDDCLPGFAQDDLLYVSNVLFLSLVLKDIDEQYAQLSVIKPDNIKLKEPEEYQNMITLPNYYLFESTSFSSLSSGKIKFTPSFTFNTPYDFSEYDLLQKDVSNLYNTCHSSPYLDICIKEYLEELNDKYGGKLIWDDDCLEDDQKFALHIEDCADTISETPCNCPDYSLKKDYVLKTTPKGISIETGTDKYEIDGIILDTSEIKLDESNLWDSIKSFFADEKYLSNLGNGKIGLASSIAECQPAPKTTYRFCVKSSTRLFDSRDNSFKPVEYRFAVDFSPDPIEPYPTGAAGEMMTFRSSGSREIITQVREIS